jgi:hypothetical protein
MPVFQMPVGPTERIEVRTLNSGRPAGEPATNYPNYIDLGKKPKMVVLGDRCIFSDGQSMFVGHGNDDTPVYASLYDKGLKISYSYAGRSTMSSFDFVVAIIW